MRVVLNPLERGIRKRGVRDLKRVKPEGLMRRQSGSLGILGLRSREGSGREIISHMKEFSSIRKISKVG